MENEFTARYMLPMDYARMMTIVKDLTDKYEFLLVDDLGYTFFGKKIPIFKIGKGQKECLYVGAHHGMEWVTTTVLLRFIEDICDCIAKKKRVYNLSLEYLFENRTIFVVPMLNPDGVDFAINGVPESLPMYERLVKMNHDSKDFSRWQANGRGVDLNHNYNSGFAEYKIIEAQHGIYGGAPTRFSGEYPESEAETSALCRFIRSRDIKYILTLHTQGEEIYWTNNGQVAPRSKQNAMIAARLTGYKLAEAEGMASYGGLTNWFIEEFNRTSLTLECGLGQNPLPASSYVSIYGVLRELLFTSPILFGV